MAMLSVADPARPIQIRDRLRYIGLSRCFQICIRLNVPIIFLPFPFISSGPFLSVRPARILDTLNVFRIHTSQELSRQ